MKYRLLFSASFLVGLLMNLSGQNFASYNSDNLILDNGVIKRIINLNPEKGAIVSQSLSLRDGKSDFISEGTLEFSFEADGKVLTGNDEWKVVNVGIIKGEREGAGATLILDHPSAKLRISITYLLYPGFF